VREWLAFLARMNVYENYSPSAVPYHKSLNISFEAERNGGKAGGDLLGSGVNQSHAARKRQLV